MIVYVVVGEDGKPLMPHWHESPEEAHQSIDFFSQDHFIECICPHCGKPEKERPANPWKRARVVDAELKVDL